MAEFDYYDLISDAFDTIDIYEGRRSFKRQIAKWPPHIRHLVAVHWCDSEISNGGLWQLFWNSTGVLVPEALDGYRAIGREDLATVVESSLQRLGTKKAASRSSRQRKLNRLKKEGQDLNDLDDVYFAAKEDRELLESMNAYAKEHAQS